MNRDGVDHDRGGLDENSQWMWSSAEVVARVQPNHACLGVDTRKQASSSTTLTAAPAASNSHSVRDTEVGQRHEMDHCNIDEGLCTSATSRLPHLRRREAFPASRPSLRPAVARTHQWSLSQSARGLKDLTSCPQAACSRLSCITRAYSQHTHVSLTLSKLCRLTQRRHCSTSSRSGCCSSSCRRCWSSGTSCCCWLRSRSRERRSCCPASRCKYACVESIGTE